VNLLRYVVKCTVTDLQFNTQASCLKCPPSAWIHFLTCVTREPVNLRSTAALLMLFAALCIRWSSSLFLCSFVDMCSWLELCRWINSSPLMIRNIFFTDEAHFTRDGVNKTRNSHLWDRDNPHGTVESNYQHRFSVNVWCGVISDQFIGPYIFLQRLTGDI